MNRFCKLKRLIWLSAIAFAVSPGWGQNAKVSVRMKSNTVKELISSIEKQTGYKFSYDSEIGKIKIPGTVVKKDVPVSAVLKEILPGLGLNYSMMSDKMIAISANNKGSFNIAQRKNDSLSSVQVKGVVVDQNGEPLTGATVAVDESNAVTTADLDGKFLISVAPGQTLKFTMVGMQPVKIKFKGDRTDYRVELRSDDKLLSQVVVVGYGTMEKKRVTSAITSINADELISGLGGATIASALQGKVSGMTITGSASPNASSGYQLRGVSSVKGSNAPLVVIDGIPGGDLRAINQEDIESIDVLKDASAGAIYGTRASGGVILITTKKAKEGKAKVTYSAEVSTETIRKRLDMLTPEEYLAHDRGVDFGARTDWYDLLCQDTPISQRHTLTMSGGTKNMSLYSSLVYADQNGIVIGDGRKDYSVRTNGRYVTMDNKLELGVRMQYRETERDQRNASDSFQQTIAINPTVPVMDPDNPFRYNVDKAGMGNDFYNPIANIMDQTYSGVDQWFMGDFSVKLNILPGLSLQANAGVDRRQWQRTIYYNQFHRYSVNGGKLGQANFRYQRDLNLNYDAYASYIKQLNENNFIDLVGGWSYFYESGQEAFSMTNSDFTVDGIGPWDMGVGKDLVNGLASMSSNKSATEKLLSFYGRANYSYADKYIGTASYRREGSSKFGVNHRWGNFWSVSGGWRLNRESFLADVEWIDELKLRVGYGVTGNNNFASGNTVSNYISDQMYTTPGGLPWGPAYKSARNANPDLKWEEKKEFNVGVDFGFLNNRITGKFDWFSRVVDDMLFAVTAPAPPSTSKTITKNIGTLTNKGWEMEVTGRIIQSADFGWTSTVRVSHNESKIKNLGEESSQVLSDALPQSMGNTHKLVNGMTIGQFWLLKNAGVDENGEFLIYNADGEVVPAKGNDNIANKHYVGNAVPKYVLSFDNSFRYKDFDLAVNCRSYIDFDVFDTVNLFYGLQNQQGVNVLRSAYTDNAAVKGNRITCDYFLSDATFFKIDAVSLGYNIKLSKYQKYVNSLRLYLTARDVAVFTKFKGYNPEQNINGLFPGVLQFGSQNSIYPQTVNWTIGAQLKF